MKMMIPVIVVVLWCAVFVWAAPERTPSPNKAELIADDAERVALVVLTNRLDAATKLEEVKAAVAEWAVSSAAAKKGKKDK